MKDTLTLERELLTTRALLARQEANVTALLARIDELENLYHKSLEAYAEERKEHEAVLEVEEKRRWALEDENNELRARVAELEAERDAIQADGEELLEENKDEEEDADVYTSDTGKHFVLQQPYLDGAADTRGYYTATATCREDGRTYRLYWDILDDYDAADGDEANACDWDTIADYEEIG